MAGPAALADARPGLASVLRLLSLPWIPVRRTGWEASMNYLLLICGDETAAEHAEDGCDGWAEEMLRRDVLRGGGGLRAPPPAPHRPGGGGLRPPHVATTVRVREDSVLLSDGPFAETKEQIGGFCLIECTDLDEAIEIAPAPPAAAYGTIEVRPLRSA